MQVQLSGLASGFDWNSMVDQLTDLERLPQKRLLLEQSALFEKKNTYSSLSTELTVFKGKLEGLAMVTYLTKGLSGILMTQWHWLLLILGPCRAPMISTSLSFPLPQAKLVPWM